MTKKSVGRLMRDKRKAYFAAQAKAVPSATVQAVVAEAITAQTTETIVKEAPNTENTTIENNIIIGESNNTTTPTPKRNFQLEHALHPAKQVLIREAMMNNTDNLLDLKMPMSNWEDLTPIYHDNIQLILQYFERAKLATHPVVWKYCADKTELANLTKGLASNVETLRIALDVVYSKHKGRTGPAKDENENINIIMLFEEYQSILDEHHGRHLIPLVTRMDAIFRDAQLAEQADNEKLKAEQAEADLADQTKVSDVEVRDIPRQSIEENKEQA